MLDDIRNLARMFARPCTRALDGYVPVPNPMRARLVYVSGGQDFLLFEVDRMTPYEPRFDGRSAADWLLDAEHFERMADQLKGKRKLSRSFRELAAEARRKAASLG